MNKKGFTLVELLAVIIILGVLALITGTTVTHFVKSAQKDLDEKQLHNIKLAAKTYYIENKDLFNNIDSCVTLTLEFLKKQGYIDKNIKNPSSNEKIGDNIGDNIYVNINLDKDNTSYEVHNNENDNCTLINIENGVEKLLNQSNLDISTSFYDGNINQMYAFSHEETHQTKKLVDYRYIGKEPYNYVKYNNETWRIVGVFEFNDDNNKNIKRIKITSDNFIGKMAWDTNNLNDWSNSSLNQYLNNDYYLSLTETAKKLIANNIFYLGGIDYMSINGEDYYKSERGDNARSVGTKIGSIEEKIALLNPSDYIFTFAKGFNSVCYDNPYNCAIVNSHLEKINPPSWLVKTDGEFLLNPSLNNSTSSVNCHNGTISKGTLRLLDSNNVLNIRPTLYLKENVKIVGGDGTKDKPYQLSM